MPKKKAKLTCLSVDCPERTGGPCNALERMLAKAFPEGIAIPKKAQTELEKRQARAKDIIRFLETIGYRLLNADTKKRTVEFSLFVGNPETKKGLEMRWECPVEFLVSGTRKELMDGLLAYVAGSYIEAARKAEENTPTL